LFDPLTGQRALYKFDAKRKLDLGGKRKIHGAVTGDPPHHKLDAAVLTNVTGKQMQTDIGGAADSRDGWIAQLDLELTILFFFFFSSTSYREAKAFGDATYFLSEANNQLLPPRAEHPLWRYNWKRYNKYVVSFLLIHSII
jgi:hypothetical protein